MLYVILCANLVTVRGGDYRGDGGDTSPPTFWLGDANVNVPPH